MAYIKFVNEDCHKRYDTSDDIENMIAYIFNPNKTTYDSKRPGHTMYDFVGCSPFLGTESQMIDPALVAKQMIFNNSFYNKNNYDLIKHRIISFEPTEYVHPKEAYYLAQTLLSFYTREGYIAAFGVHLDTENIHIHLAINTISWLNGNRFSFSFEKKSLYSYLSCWMQEHDQFLVDSAALEKRKKYYGHN